MTEPCTHPRRTNVRCVLFSAEWCLDCDDWVNSAAGKTVELEERAFSRGRRP